MSYTHVLVCTRGLAVTVTPGMVDGYEHQIEDQVNVVVQTASLTLDFS